MNRGWNCKRGWWGWAVVISGWLVATATAATQPPPKKVFTRVVDYMTPVTQTVDQRLTEVDSALRVRVRKPGVPRPFVESIEEELRRQGHRIQPQPVIVTQYEVEVLEVIKAHTRTAGAGAMTQVLQMGGEADWEGNRYVTETDVPRLVSGAEYLLFLKFSANVDGMLISPWDIYRVDTSTVEANAAGASIEFGKQLVGRPPAEALGLVRDAASRLAAGIAPLTP